MNKTEVRKSHVLALHNQGYNLIPMGEDKKPATKWKEWQSIKMPNDTLKELGKKFADNHNWALITGYCQIAEHGIIAVDCDDDEAVSQHPK